MAAHLAPTEPMRVGQLLARFPLKRTAILLTSALVMGTGVTLLVTAHLGLLPIDVLHRGVATRGGFTFGGGIIGTQAILLMIAIPLRVKIGTGTVLAFLIPAMTADLLLSLVPPAQALPIRIAAFVAGGALFCVGVAGYLTASLGILPRDGIMLVLGRNRPRHIAAARIAIDAVFVLVGGLLLGPADAIRHGDIGIGTVVLALTGGPAIAAALPLTARILREPVPTRGPRIATGAPADAPPRKPGAHRRTRKATR